MSSRKTNEENILKTRDDRIPMRFTSDASNSFNVIGEDRPPWADDKFDAKLLRQRIEPWLTALFQSEHLSLLVGSGLTHAVHTIATCKGAAGMTRCEFVTCKDEIANEAVRSAKSSERKEPNFEDDIRVANELLKGLEILGDPRAITLGQEINSTLKDFATLVLKSETNIATAEDTKRLNALNTLVNFLMSFASRTGTRERLNIFTTNYDRVIEAGSELAGLHLLDRFVGNLTPIFRSSRLDVDMHYNPPGIRGEPRYLEGVARFTKLHGSLDWIQSGNDIRRVGMSFGAKSIEHYLPNGKDSAVDALKLMIYPNSAKDSETALYPYVELFRDLAAALSRPNSTLVTYGYSFGDEHINRMIRDMLTIPSTHLVIIAYGDSLGRIMKTYEDIGRPSQITLLIGPELGDLSKLTDNYLPKSAIDRTTTRMAEILKDRFGVKESEKSSGDNNTDDQDIL